MKKRFLAIPLSILLAACSFTSFAAGLVQNGDNVQYESNDGTLLFDKFQKIDGSYYYFDDNGNMAKDCLVEYESNKYYLGKDGKKLTDAWVKIQEKDNKDPYWFYFDDKGRAKEEGWLTWKGKKYHVSNYHMDYGWFMDEEGDEYYLNGPDDGHMETGWLPYTEDEEIDPEGKHRTGWYYFLTASGKMVKSTEKKIVSKYYAFGEDGLMIDGFGYVENYNNLSDADKFVVKYYDKITGVRADGWRYIQGEDDEDAAVKREDGWYYFKNGEASTAYSDTKLINLETGIRKIGADYYAKDQFAFELQYRKDLDADRYSSSYSTVGRKKDKKTIEGIVMGNSEEPYDFVHAFKAHTIGMTDDTSLSDQKIKSKLK